MKYFLLLLVSAILVCSCKKEEPAAFSSIKAGTCEAGVVSGMPIVICVDSVLSDSRCPINVNCVHAGYTHARFTISIADSAPQTFELGLKTHSPRNMQFAVERNGYRFTFTRLQPYPGEANYTYQNLRATVSIEKL